MSLREGGNVNAVLVAVLLGAAGPQPAESPVPLALTVSGGVSLGAYEAGFLYYALELAKANPAQVELKLVTGSSAGSVNGFVAVLSGCGPPDPDPTGSLFWRIWIPIGLEQLHVPEDVTPVSLFSRRSFDPAVARVEKGWNEGLPEHCDMVLGVSTTRQAPRVVDLAHERLEVPRIEEKFALRIRGRGVGRPLLATNYFDPKHELPQPLLPTGPDGAVPFAAVRDLVLASSAFPLAFPPLPLAHCLSEPGAASQVCTPERARTAPFFDGGVLDGRPLRLAARLAGAGLRSSRGLGAAWLDAPRLASFRPPAGMLFGFVDPDATAYPSAEDARPSPPTESLASLLRKLGSNWIAGARSKELYTLLEEHPELAERIRMPRRHFPAAGDPLAAFFGFIETDFRVFDFYLGMYDARRTFLQGNGPSRRASPLRSPEPSPAAGATGPAGWRPFVCLRALLDGVDEFRSACDGPSMANFRILAQVSLERLHDACERAGGGEREGERLACAASAQLTSVPRVAPAPPGAWRRAAGESELVQVTRLLAAHRFEFRDLGLGPDEGGRALTRVRVRLGRLADEVTSRQPIAEAAIVALLARPAVDLLAYAPPSHIVYLTFGRVIELGWSVSDPESRRFPAWLRLAAGLQVYGALAALSSETKFFGAAGVAGLELQPPVTGASVLQFRLSLRGGYLLASGDHFLQAPCAYGEGSVDRIGRCSGPVVDLGLSATLFERVRLQILGQWFPATRAGQSVLWAISPGAGLQVSY